MKTKSHTTFGHPKKNQSELPMEAPAYLWLLWFYSQESCYRIGLEAYQWIKKMCLLARIHTHVHTSYSGIRNKTVIKKKHGTGDHHVK